MSKKRLLGGGRENNKLLRGLGRKGKVFHLSSIVYWKK